jgi:YihY family inner membrane protein
LAVLRKFRQDRAGDRAALIAFYGFFALFPLLLGLSAAAGWILHGNEDLQGRLTDSALTQFPIIGAQIKGNLGTFKGSWVALLLGFGGALWAGARVMNATRSAMNAVWDAPKGLGPAFVHTALRDLLTLVALGAFVVAGAVVGGLAGALAGTFPGWVAGLAVSAVLDAFIFAVVFRLLTTVQLSWRSVAPGAVVAGVAWAILQGVGGYLLSHRIQQTQELYGFFAIVIGLLSWIFLAAQVTLLAAEVNAVRARGHARGVGDAGPG